MSVFVRFRATVAGGCPAVERADHLRRGLLPLSNALGSRVDPTAVAQASQSSGAEAGPSGIDSLLNPGIIREDLDSTTGGVAETARCSRWVQLRAVGGQVHRRQVCRPSQRLDVVPAGVVQHQIACSSPLMWLDNPSMSVRIRSGLLPG